nr:type II toxin-antitoxin system RelE/ParE family toxin [Halothiobacillus sp.]
MHIEQTTRFAKAVKKLHPNQKADLDNAIHALIATPE